MPRFSLRTLLRPGPLLILAFLAGVVALSRWISTLGGPEVILERFGVAAPLVLVAVQAALAAGPVPSELFAIVSAGAYGWALGSVMTWAGWTIGSMIQYALARRGAEDVPIDLTRVPAWLRRFPVDHPVFLVCVRWLPMGYHLANLVAGARRVPVGRQLLVSAIGSVPGAVIWAGIGAGVSLW